MFTVSSLLFGILLVLIYSAYIFEKHLQSLSEINTQMKAFIKGASCAFELDAKDIDVSLVSAHTLYWWAALGRRVYDNHGYWFHEHNDEKPQSRERP